MATLADIRQQYPQYSDLSDMQLARALHGKYYSDIEFGTFARKIGMLESPEVTGVEDYNALQEQRRQGRGPTLTQPVEYRTALEGAGKFFTDIAMGAKQLARLHPMIPDNPQQGQEAQAKRELDQPLMETGAGKAGYVGAGILSTVPTAAIPGANTVTGSALIGGTLGALQPTVTQGERAANTAIGAGVGAASQYIGQKIASWAGNRITRRTEAAQTRAAENSVRDATLAKAREAGYVVPPSTTNPTAANRIAESVSGKAQTQQAAAVRNQAVTNRLVRADLGLPENSPLTRDSLKAIRERAGGVYRAIRNSGEIAVDSAYIDDLARLTESIDEVAKDFPDANVGSGKEINELVDSLLRDKFQASSAVEYTKQLRYAAGANLAHGVDPTRRSLGLAQREAAGALEDMILRHLQSKGQAHLASRFDKARVLIAKTYTVENALNESTGNVVATALARELKRGKPLTGGIATAASFAQAFPRVAQEITHSPGVSAVDALVGGVGAATVNPSMIALPAARIGAREAILTPTYQSAMGTPSYAPGTRALSAVGAGGRALPALGRASVPLVTVPYPEEKKAP